MRRPSDRPLRADAQRTREQLLDALGDLVHERGLEEISLPDLARAAGVATATVYRHFDEIQQLRQAYYARALSALLDDWDQLSASLTGRALFDAANLRWIEHMTQWAHAARHLRSAEGYLARSQAGDPVMARHAALLDVIVGAVVSDGTIPEQNRDYAALVWVNMFDERVYVDLADTLRWDTSTIAARLGATTLAALQGSEARPTSDRPAE